MSRQLIAALLLGLLSTGLASAQDPDLVLTSDSGALVSGTVDIDVTFDNTGAEVVQGWSYGICHDPAVVALLSASAGSTVATVQAGMAPDFESTVVFPGEGYTTGVVIDFLGGSDLAPGTGFEFSTATYQAVGDAGQTTALEFCNDIGVIPVSTVITIGGGVSATPVTNDGSIELLDQTFYYESPDQTVVFDGAGDAAFSAVIAILEDEGNAGYPNDVLAFSMSVAHDDTYLSVVDAAEAGAVASAAPDFFGVSTYSNGVTVGVVFAFEMDMALQFGSSQSAVSVDYETNGPALAGASDDVVTSLSFEPLGNPAVQNVVVVGLSEIGVVADEPAITLTNSASGIFVRGAINPDDSLAPDIADAVFLLNYLFVPGSEVPTCLDAADTNDDGGSDVADSVYLLNYLFVPGSPAPPPPFGACGADPTDDSLGCDSHQPCD